MSYASKRTEYYCPFVFLFCLLLVTISVPIHTTPKISPHKSNTKERVVAVGRKYWCRSLLWICLLWELLQSLFHVQMGWNSKLWQSLSMEPFCLWPDKNLLAWSGAIHLYKKELSDDAAIKVVKCITVLEYEAWQSHQYFVHYLGSIVPFYANMTSAGIIVP